MQQNMNNKIDATVQKLKQITSFYFYYRAAYVANGANQTCIWPYYEFK